MTNVHRKSATIYQFPVGGRAGLRRVEAFNAPASRTPDRIADIAFGGSWYHEEAVREAAERPRKN